MVSTRLKIETARLKAGERKGYGGYRKLVPRCQMTFGLFDILLLAKLTKYKCMNSSPHAQSHEEHTTYEEFHNPRTRTIMTRGQELTRAAEGNDTPNYAGKIPFERVLNCRDVGDFVSLRGDVCVLECLSYERQVYLYM